MIGPPTKEAQANPRSQSRAFTNSSMAEDTVQPLDALGIRTRVHVSWATTLAGMVAWGVTALLTVTWGRSARDLDRTGWPRPSTSSTMFGVYEVAAVSRAGHYLVEENR